MVLRGTSLPWYRPGESLNLSRCAMKRRIRLAPGSSSRGQAGARKIGDLLELANSRRPRPPDDMGSVEFVVGIVCASSRKSSGMLTTNSEGCAGTILSSASSSLCSGSRGSGNMPRALMPNTYLQAVVVSVSSLSSSMPLRLYNV